MDPNEIVISQKEFHCGSSADKVTLDVTAGSQWTSFVYVQDPTIDQTQNWAKPRTSNGYPNKKYSVSIEVESNRFPSPRKIQLAFMNTESMKTELVTITQDGKPTSEKTAYIIPDKFISSTYFTGIQGSKTTVKSDEYGLWFYGWNLEDDRRFSLEFPDDMSDCSRLIMTYRMGCGPQGGSGYDHNTNIAFLHEGEWIEIASCITPFGNAFTQSFEKKFYFDVTEYKDLLTGPVDFKIYFGGFDASETGRHHTAQLTFDIYEGTPERHTVFVQRLYDSEETDNTGYRSWCYGLEDISIEDDDRLSPRSIEIPAGVKNLEMKVTITGHGADLGKFLDRSNYTTRNAAEFDYNYYTVKINGVPFQQKGYIFVPCGENYAQAGTCYYDRANWCPGNPAHFDKWRFLNFQEGDVINLDIDLERFKSEFPDKNHDGLAKYRVHVDLFGFDN